MSNYITMIHNMVDDMPVLKEHWQQKRVLLFQLTETAKKLSSRHQECLTGLLEQDPGSNHLVASSRAMEMAIQEIREELMHMMDGQASTEAPASFLDPLPLTSNPNFVQRVSRNNRSRSLFEGPPATSVASGKPPPAAIEELTTDMAPAIPPSEPRISSGEIGKARDIIASIRTLKTIEAEHRPATDDEKSVLRRFAGFGPVALSIFPNPGTGNYKDAGWEALGRELESLLSREEYDSAERTTFNAFYTSPKVIRAMHTAIGQLGVGEQATILEPGCGVGNFVAHAKPSQRFIGVEMDALSGWIAKAIHPEHDIRIENFRSTKLPDGKIDAIIGNVPFADVKLEHKGVKYSLHDYFFAKSLDALRPGGVLALVTSHFTMDKQNAAIREYLADQADFVGAIRLPSDAFKREGTSVVTDIVFLRKRGDAEPASHVDPDWLKTGDLDVDGVTVPVNQYFLNHPEMVLGDWSRKDTL